MNAPAPVNELTLAAPAKINLYLHSVGKRADGYHLLDTAFQLIDLHDTLRLRTRSDARIVLHTPIAQLPDAQHLAVRAAQLLQSHTGQACGADIWVDKRIPSGAGLGGGSSDAATTLMGLNRLWNCGLSPVTLQALGVQLGADVPFFCSGWGAARGEGVGEILSPLMLGGGFFTVIYPACHVPTPAVFRHPDLTWRAKQAIIYALEEKHVNLFASDFFSNDLEQVATHIAPPIGHAIASLKAAGGAQMVRMSGSGSAVFAQYASANARQTAWLVLQSQRLTDWQAWQVNGLQKHPMTE